MYAYRHFYHTFYTSKLQPVQNVTHFPDSQTSIDLYKSSSLNNFVAKARTWSGNVSVDLDCIRCVEFGRIFIHFKPFITIMGSLQGFDSVNPIRYAHGPKWFTK